MTGNITVAILELKHVLVATKLLGQKWFVFLYGTILFVCVFVLLACSFVRSFGYLF